MAELVKLAILLALLCFILPILIYLVFWTLGALASGNVIPFLIFLIVSLWAIAGH
jgi:hypothetical protein